MTHSSFDNGASAEDPALLQGHRLQQQWFLFEALIWGQIVLLEEVSEDVGEVSTNIIKNCGSTASHHHHPLWITSVPMNLLDGYKTISTLEKVQLHPVGPIEWEHHLQTIIFNRQLQWTFSRHSCPIWRRGRGGGGKREAGSPFPPRKVQWHHRGKEVKWHYQLW